MAIREILVYPDPRLNETSKPVSELTPQVVTLIKDMIETMYARDGGGLAAVQVGVHLRIFIVDPTLAGGTKKDEAMVFINPEILEMHGEELRDEGCLSFPGVWVPRKRAKTTTIRARDLNWEEFEMTGEGIVSRAFQHESDHLDGRLLIEPLTGLRRKMALRRLSTR
ncbi:peptide deformylase [Myxococcota bacterium]|nr:peptide deformylase [Myxococcota bacterium]